MRVFSTSVSALPLAADSSHLTSLVVFPFLFFFFFNLRTSFKRKRLNRRLRSESWSSAEEPWPGWRDRSIPRQDPEPSGETKVSVCGCPAPARMDGSVRWPGRQRSREAMTQNGLGMGLKPSVWGERPESTRFSAGRTEALMQRRPPCQVPRDRATARACFSQSVPPRTLALGWQPRGSRCGGPDDFSRVQGPSARAPAGDVSRPCPRRLFLRPRPFLLGPASAVSGMDVGGVQEAQQAGGPLLRTTPEARRSGHGREILPAV